MRLGVRGRKVDYDVAKRLQDEGLDEKQIAERMEHTVDAVRETLERGYTYRNRRTISRNHVERLWRKGVPQCEIAKLARGSSSQISKIISDLRRGIQ